MDFDLSPSTPQKTLFQGEGGSYKAWSTSDLAKANLAAGFLLLKPRGFALPHSADCQKIGYVLQGTEGIVGMVLPGSSKELVLKLKKGDVIPAPLGCISWWYNNGDSDFVMVFSGETSNAILPGDITYFLLSGPLGIIGGFSSEFTSQTYNMSLTEATKLAKSQTGILIIKLEKGISMPQPHDDDDLPDKLVYNIEAASTDIEVQNGGCLKTLTADKFPVMEKVGLTGGLLKLNPNAMYSPTAITDGSNQLVYVAKGSGQVQIVGPNGKLALDARIEEGQLFLVPKFFPAAEIAGSEGLELLFITKSSWTVVEEFATKKSAWNALSPVVSQVSLNISPELQKLFKSSLHTNSVIIPPTN